MAKKRILNTIFKWSLLLLLMGYTTWISVWARKEADSRVCHEIKVDIKNSRPTDSITRRGVIHELSRYPAKIVGTPLSSLNTQGIENYLSKLRNFENVECNITSGGNLKITVKPMVPVMRIFTNGKSFYVNRNGKFVESNPEFFADVPIVSGRFKKGFQPVDILPVIDFVKTDPFLNNFISMTVAESADNIILVPRILGHVINFGDVSRLDEKRDALLLFYRKVIPYKGWEEYDTISVKFKGQIVATRRNKTIIKHSSDEIEDVDMEEATLPELTESNSAPGAGHEKKSNTTPADNINKTTDVNKPEKKKEEAA